MAHGRTGPDIVMNTRYAGPSQIRSVSVHQKKRTPDGSSAIDPARSRLNEVLEGPATQSEALDRLWAAGVKPPTAQAEKPYVQLVLSASPSFFRTDGRGAGQWDESRLKAWKAATMAWLREEYGEDLAHAALHLDEDTPHIHALVVPTYEKRPRTPGKPKRGETAEEFEARKREALEAPTVRTVGRSSNDKWRRPYARRDARRSYHAAVEGLGLGYGRDFLAEGEPSPKHKTTGQWVREQAAEVAQEKARVEATAAAVIEGAEATAAAVVQEAEAVAAEAEARRVEAEEEALRVSTKAGALLTATAALTAEMTAGTLRRTSEGKIRVQNREAIQGGLPELANALRAATDAAEARRGEEQAAEAAKASRAAEEAAAEAARAEAAQILQQAQADRTAAAVDRKTAGRLIERLNGLLDQAGTFLRMPGLSKAVRDAGAALLTAAGRAVPEPDATSHGGGGSKMRRMAGLDAAPPASASAPQPRPEARNPAPLSVDRTDDFSL